MLLASVLLAAMQLHQQLTELCSAAVHDSFHEATQAAAAGLMQGQLTQTQTSTGSITSCLAGHCCCLNFEFVVDAVTASCCDLVHGRSCLWGLCLCLRLHYMLQFEYKRLEHSAAETFCSWLVCDFQAANTRHISRKSTALQHRSIIR